MEYKYKPGDKVGYLVLTERFIKRMPSGGQPYWHYECECGEAGTTSQSNLSCGKSRSCGCRRAEHKYKPGDKIGRLTLISRFIKRTAHSENAVWKYKCECGTTGTVHQGNLTAGTSGSCGCLHSEIVKATKTVHGESDKAPEWFTWMGMIQRCENKKNPQYKDYGGRGIRIYPRWRKSYPAFLLDVGRRPSPSHTLNRKNNNKGYYPGNVNWATWSEQNRNRRSNVVLRLNGTSRTVIEWAELRGMSPTTIYGRLRRGWPPKEAVFVLPRKIRKVGGQKL